MRGRQATMVLAALFLTATTSTQGATAITPDRLHEALEWGLSAPETELEQYPLCTERTWLINFDTPFLRVAQFSRAMKIQNTPATDSDVSPKLAGEELHVYAHARVGATGGPLPNIDYVVILRARPGGVAETVLPTSVQSFVRRVPIDADSGRTRIARSVKAVFPLGALVAGNEVRLTFENGTFQTVAITPETLARVR